MNGRHSCSAPVDQQMFENSKRQLHTLKSNIYIYISQQQAKAPTSVEMVSNAENDRTTNVVLIPRVFFWFWLGFSVYIFLVAGDELFNAELEINGNGHCTDC